MLEQLKHFHKNGRFSQFEFLATNYLEMTIAFQWYRLMIHYKTFFFLFWSSGTPSLGSHLADVISGIQLSGNALCLANNAFRQPCVWDGPGFKPLINRIAVRRANHSAMGPRYRFYCKQNFLCSAVIICLTPLPPMSSVIIWQPTAPKTMTSFVNNP